MGGVSNRLLPVLVDMLLRIPASIIRNEFKRMRRFTLLIFLAALNVLCSTDLMGRTCERENTHSLPSLKLSFAYPPGPADRSGSEGESPALPDKKLGRAVLEFFGLMAYSQTKYWVTYGSWVEDWRYRLTWEDQKKRFFGFEAWRFDSNCFNLNWTHALAGTLYYSFARTNNLSVLESFLFTTAGSLYWEYVVEWRNVISINDNLFSAFGGIPTGEAWFQLGRYFSARGGLLDRILSFLNPILKFNDWLDRREPKEPRTEGENGWHDFSFSLGTQSRRSGSQGDRSVLWGSVRTQIVGIPEYGQPGEVRRGIHTTAASEISAEFFLGSRGLEESGLFVKAALLGHYVKDVRENGTGHEFFLGLGSAFSYYRRTGTAFYDSCDVKVRRGHDLRLEEARDFKDKFSIVHIAGPVALFDAYFRRVKLRLTLDACVDFALVNALALNDYSAEHDITGFKTTVLHYGYYYALGASLMSGCSVEFGNFRLQGLARYHYFDSVEGRDRFQDELADDAPIVDSRLRLRADLSYRFFGSPVEMRLSYEGIDRRGRIRSTHFQETESRYNLGVTFRF